MANAKEEPISMVEAPPKDLVDVAEGVGLEPTSPFGQRFQVMSTVFWPFLPLPNPACLGGPITAQPPECSWFVLASLISS
jgi:hypothetical protein